MKVLRLHLIVYLFFTDFDVYGNKLKELEEP